MSKEYIRISDSEITMTDSTKKNILTKDLSDELDALKRRKKKINDRIDEIDALLSLKITP